MDKDQVEPRRESRELKNENLETYGKVATLASQDTGTTMRREQETLGIKSRVTGMGWEPRRVRDDSCIWARGIKSGGKQRILLLPWGSARGTVHRLVVDVIPPDPLTEG